MTQASIQAGLPGTRGSHPLLSQGHGITPTQDQATSIFHAPSSVCGSSTPGNHGREVQGYLPPPHLIGQKLCPRHTGGECWGPNPLPLSLPVSRDFVLGEASQPGRPQATAHSAHCWASKGVVLREVDWCPCPSFRAVAQRFCPGGETSHKNREL